MAAAAVKRSLQQLDIAKKNSEGLPQEFMEHMLMCAGFGSIIYEELRKILLTDSCEQCRLALGDLSPISMGGGGVSWLKGFKGSTFADLAEHAKGNILAMDSKEFVQKQSALAEACDVN